MTPFCASATKATLSSLALTYLELKEKRRFWYMYGNLNFFLYLKIAVFFSEHECPEELDEGNK